MEKEDPWRTIEKTEENVQFKTIKQNMFSNRFKVLSAIWFTYRSPRVSNTYTLLESIRLYLFAKTWWILLKRTFIRRP